MVTPANRSGSPTYGTTEFYPQQLLEACKGNDKKLVESILKNSSSAEIKNAIEQRDEEGNSPLHLASQKGNVGVVTLLIQAGADVDALNRANQTPLHQACIGTMTPFDQTSEGKQKETVEVLLTAGANPNIVSYDGKNALHEACESQFEEIVELLLNSGKIKNINLPDQLGYTPLAAACSRKNRRIVELLIQAKVDVNTLIHIKYSNIRCYPLHLTHSDPKITKLLIDAGAKLDVTNSSGMSPLVLACFENSERTVELLLESGADRNLATNNNLTPLMIATGKNFPQIVRLLLNDPEKINVDGADKNGNTPLIYASSKGNRKEITALLLAAGANKEISNNEGMTALHLACTNGGNAEIIEMLLTNDLSNHAASNAPAILSAAEESEPNPVSSSHSISDPLINPNLPPPISSGPTPVSSSSSSSSMATTPEH